MVGRLENLKNALLEEDYATAGDLAEDLRLIVSRTKNLETILIAELDDLYDWLLTIADQLFTAAPTEAENKYFQQQLKKASDLLSAGTVDAANKAAILIADATKAREERLHQLETNGYYDRDIFCLFWLLWHLLDEILRHPCFPSEDYEVCAARLYGTLTSALQSRKAVVTLGRFSEFIFPEEKDYLETFLDRWNKK